MNEQQSFAVGDKRCSRCGEVKPLDSFRRNKSGRLRSLCRSCDSEAAMEYRDRYPDRVLDQHLRRNFGITLDEFNKLNADQGGVCAICGNPPIVNFKPSRRQGRAVRPRLVVDHDHATGEIRGLLCTPCNRGIGLLGDDPKLVAAALRYLGGESNQ